MKIFGLSLIIFGFLIAFVLPQIREYQKPFDKTFVISGIFLMLIGILMVI